MPINPNQLLTPIVTFLAFMLLFVGTSSADEAAKKRSLLKRSTDTSWYSSEESNSALPAPPETVSIDVSDRHDSIKANAGTNASSKPFQNKSWFARLLEWCFEYFYSIWTFVVLFAFLFLFVVIGYFLMRTRRNRNYHRKSESRNVKGARGEAKVTDLPFELEHSAGSLLAQADVYRKQGDYSKALIYLYSHLLMELDNASLIRLERGKTNRRYLRELSGHVPLKNYLTTTVRWFEAVFFGKHPIDLETFDSLRAKVPEFESKVRQAVNQAKVAPLQEVSA